MEVQNKQGYIFAYSEVIHQVHTLSTTAENVWIWCITCNYIYHTHSYIHADTCRVFGCEITDKALPKLVDFFSVTKTFEVIQ